MKSLKIDGIAPSHRIIESSSLGSSAAEAAACKSAAVFAPIDGVLGRLLSKNLA
jgi:hypothetical protein